MARREGLRDDHQLRQQRPEPPALDVQGRPMPRVVGQLRAIRSQWSAEQELLDQEDLAAFEFVERREQKRQEKESKEECSIEQEQKREYQDLILKRQRDLRQLLVDMRTQNHEILQLKVQGAEIKRQARQQELFEARLELGFVREDRRHTGTEDVFDAAEEEDDEDFLFATLPGTHERAAAACAKSHEQQSANDGTEHRQGATQTLSHPRQSPATKAGALIAKRQRMQLLRNNDYDDFREEGKSDHAPASGQGWSSEAAMRIADNQAKKLVLQRQIKQLKHHVRCLTKSRSDVRASKTPVPISTAIQRACDHVGYLDDENEHTHNFELYPVPSNALLINESRRKLWYSKMKLAVECRLRLLHVTKHALQQIEMGEVEAPEPIFRQAARERDADALLAASVKGWHDNIAGPKFDYDYASIDEMGHPGVVGFSAMTLAQLQPLRDKRRRAQHILRQEKQNLLDVIDAAGTEVGAQKESLKFEMMQHELLQLSLERGSKDASHLDTQVHLLEEKLLVLKRERDEAEVSITRVTRRQLSVVLTAWRAFTCAARPESHPNAATHPHIKRIIAAHEPPGHMRSQVERPQCKSDLASMAQELRAMGGVGAEEMTILQPWLGACIRPKKFKEEADTDGYFCDALEVEHIYGYRGNDCRANVFHMRTGEVVYSSGSVGIVHNLVEGSRQHRQVWFKNWHNGPISCVALHPDGCTIATAESIAGEAKADFYPAIHVWRVQNGDSNLIATLNLAMHKRERVGMVESSFSCIAFSKGGRYLFAIGDRWPRQSVVVYEWESDQCGAIVKYHMGRQKALAVAVNPYTDSIVISGDCFLNVMSSLDDRKQQYRKDIGQLHWNLIRTDVESRATSLNKDGHDADWKTSKQNESGRGTMSISLDGFQRLIKFIRDCKREAGQMISTNQPVSAIAESTCGLYSCEQLLALVDQGLVHEGHADLDAIGQRSVVQQLQKELESLVMASTDALHGHQAIYERTYKIDDILHDKVKEMQNAFSHLLNGTLPMIEDLFRRTEGGLKELIRLDKQRSLFLEPCQHYNRLGAPYWKINQDSPFLHTPRMQAMFCIAFTGPYTFVSGSEDGSVFFWDGSELIGATTVHEDAIIDMSIDMRDYDSNGHFHLITAGHDGAVKLSRCERFQRGVRHSFYAGIHLQPLQTIRLPVDDATGLPSPVVSVSNIIGLDKFSGFPCTNYSDKPAGHASFFTMRSGVEFLAEPVQTSKYPLIVGTANNSLFYVSFENFGQSVSTAGSLNILALVQAHSKGGVTCVSAHPRKKHLMFSGGDDGVCRLWDIVRRVLIKSHHVKENSISCCDFAPNGSMVAVGLSNGGFMILDSETLLPKSQVVFEFEVQWLSDQEDSLLTVRTNNGPETAAEKAMKAKRSSLIAERDLLERQSKGRQNISAADLPAYESLISQINLIEHKLISKQRRLFNGSYFVPEQRAKLARRRTLIEDFHVLQLSESSLDRAQQESFVSLQHKERQQERNLISDVDYDIVSQSVSLTFASPMTRKPTDNRATIQTFADQIRHLKRFTSVVKFSPDNRLFAVAGEDRMVYMHLITSLGEVCFKVPGHAGPVRSIDWASDSLHFQTNTDAHELRFWKTQKPERSAWYAAEIRARDVPSHWNSGEARHDTWQELVWASWSSTMGWPVLGIQTTEGMPARSTIPLHSTSSYNGDFLVWGDDSRQIYLAKFPCPSLQRIRKTVQGHCSPIKAVQFIDGGNRVASCGVGDSSIIQWRLFQEPGRIVVKEEQDGPIVVLHGDVYSKSAEKCAICFDDYCLNPKNCLEKNEKVNEEESVRSNLLADNNNDVPPLPHQASMLGPDWWSDQNSARAPLEGVELEHVYGFQGSDRKCNARILRTGEVIYTAGCIAVVSNMYTRVQRHFTKHVSAIVSFTLHPDKITICSVSNGDDPSIFVWDSVTMETKQNLKHVWSFGFTTISFFGDEGKKLLIVGNDAFQKLSAVEWETGKVLKSGVESQGDAISCVVCNDYDLLMGANFATIGARRIFFWKLCYLKESDSWTLEKERAVYRSEHTNPVCSVAMASGAYLGPLTLVTGSCEGSLYFWENNELAKTKNAHSGPIYDIKINVDEKSFVTCSGDGLIKIWATAPGGFLDPPGIGIWDTLTCTAVIAHVSVMDDVRESLGFLLLKPDETLDDVRSLIETSLTSSVYVDTRIRKMIQGCPDFLFVTDRGESLVRKKNENLECARDFRSELCLVLGQDMIDKMIDSEESSFVQKLVTKPDDIIDMACVRMKDYEKKHCEIRTIDWFQGSVVFGTNENDLFTFESLKGRRSPEKFSDSMLSKEAGPVCSHPSLPLFYTSSGKGLLQIWNHDTLCCSLTKDLGFPVNDLAISPDGYYLVGATKAGCIILKASDLQLVHKIHYRPFRSTSINAVKFSPSGHYLATGTTEGRVDLFDVHGRLSLTSWASSRLSLNLDAGGLEFDFSDGVLLCKLIENVLETFADGRTITELKTYAVVVDRVPLYHAWRDRPKRYSEKISLMSEGLEIAMLAAKKVLSLLESRLKKLDGPLRGRETMNSRETAKELIKQRILIVRDNISGPCAPDLVGVDGKLVDRWNLIAFLHFLRSMDLSVLEEQMENVQLISQTGLELENRLQQVHVLEKDVKRGRELVDEKLKRIEVAEKQRQTLFAQSMKHELTTMEREQLGKQQRLNALQAGVAKVKLRHETIKQKLERAREESFVFCGTGNGSKPHTKPINSIDWSTDGQMLQTASLDAGELKFWGADSCQQLWSDKAANKDWATHNSTLGWAVKGLTRFENVGPQHFKILNCAPAQSQSSHLLGVGDVNGRLILANFPFPYLSVEVELRMSDSFDALIGFDRATAEVEMEILVEFSRLLKAVQDRMRIVRHTGPSSFVVDIGPPIGSNDRRSAFELGMAAFECVEQGRTRRHGNANAFKLLRHCQCVKLPAVLSNIGHTAPISAAVFDRRGERVFSIGRGDRTICVWKILRPESRSQGRRIHDGVKKRLSEVLDQTTQMIRLGRGRHIEDSLLNVLCEWDIAKSGIVPATEDPVVKQVDSLKTSEISSELRRRGINLADLIERQELAARLCTAMTTPETMTVSEIRAELRQSQVSANNIFERVSLIELLLSARSLGSKFPRPIPFGFQQIAPAHERIISRARAQRQTAVTKTSKISLKEREGCILEILDAICSLNVHEARDIGVEENLCGLVTLIKCNRLRIASASAWQQQYKDELCKGLDVNSTGIKSPADTDWLIGGPSAPPQANLLKKGGYLYDSALKAVGGSLLPNSWYRFKNFPGRDFKYTRFGPDGQFLDRMEEHSTDLKRDCVQVSGLKRVRWGSRFFVKAIGNLVKAQSLPHQRKQDSAQRQLSTAYLYQTPVGVPRLRERRLPCIKQIDDLFSTLDTTRTGSVKLESFVSSITRDLAQCEMFGLPVQGTTDAEIVQNLIFMRGMLSPGNLEEDSSDKSELLRPDLCDFLLPNINVRGHLSFKVRITRLVGDLKIGFVDVLRISQGIGLDTDWCSQDFPSWYLDSLGGLRVMGKEVARTDTKLSSSDIILAEVDQNLVSMLEILLIVPVCFCLASLSFHVACTPFIDGLFDRVCCGSSRKEFKNLLGC